MLRQFNLGLQLIQNLPPPVSRGVISVFQEHSMLYDRKQLTSHKMSLLQKLEKITKQWTEDLKWMANEQQPSM